MFDSITRRERINATRVLAVVAIAGAAFAAEAALFVKIVGQPLEWVVRASPPQRAQPARDDLPSFGEEIEVVAPHRPRRASAAVRLAPWKDPDPATVAINGYCLVER